MVVFAEVHAFVCTVMDPREGNAGFGRIIRVIAIVHHGSRHRRMGLMATCMEGTEAVPCSVVRDDDNLGAWKRQQRGKHLQRFCNVEMNE